MQTFSEGLKHQKVRQQRNILIQKDKKTKKTSNSIEVLFQD